MIPVLGNRLKANQFFGICRSGDWVCQDIVDPIEYGCIRRNTYGERKHCDQREPWIAAQLANGVPDILHDPSPVASK